jgi:transposase
MGGRLIRGKLFMCSFSAKKTNAACAALFDRLVAKGKNKKLALIAVCNKLLKQAFAIVKSRFGRRPKTATFPSLSL